MANLLNLGVNAAKRGFLDREAILKAVGRARARVLNEQGRLVRKIAQGSLRYKAESAPPGQPPSAHRSGLRTRTSRSTGRKRTRSVSFLREFLFYAYDPASRSVVVGPAKLGGVRGTGTGATVPHVQEFGGTSTILDHGEKKRVRVNPHPFMGPALDKARPSFAAMWRDRAK